ARGADPLTELLDHSGPHPSAHPGPPRSSVSSCPEAQRGGRALYCARGRMRTLLRNSGITPAPGPAKEVAGAGDAALAPPRPPHARRPDGPLLRWFGSYGPFAVPQAAVPIAFSLIALPLTGRAFSGAAMMLAMTIAQVVGAVPITRFGRRFPPIPFL